MSGIRKTLDTTRLLGFETVDSEIDLSAPELSGRVGAKVGEPEPLVSDTDIDTPVAAD